MRKPVEHRNHKGWYVIPEFPTHLASKDGRVMILATGHITYGSAETAGYMRTHIWDKNTKTKRDIKVHVLICLAFHGARPSEMHEVDHIDNVRSNNVYTNLTWITRAENMIKANARRDYGKLKQSLFDL